MPKARLATIRKTLLALHGEPDALVPEGPFEMILWEQVAYLANDERRRQAFEALEKRIGLTPQDILRAKPEILEDVAATGGSIAPGKRADRMRATAERVMSEFDGRLEQVLDLPPDKAVRALAKFPMIGKPGAEKILLLTGTHPVLALDSNAMRVLLRLGYGSEGSSYDQTYREVRAATEAQERADTDWMGTLHQLLRRHGQEVCRNKLPECKRCPLTAKCAYHHDNVDD